MPTPTKVPYVLFYDDFSNDKSGWSSSSDAANYQYSSGQYVISAPKGNFLSWTHTNQYFSDAVLTVDAAHVSGESFGTGTAVIWRYVDNNNYYLLEISGDGYLIIESNLKATGKHYIIGLLVLQ